jgi:ribose transport system substrate-binding protein
LTSFAQQHKLADVYVVKQEESLMPRISRVLAAAFVLLAAASVATAAAVGSSNARQAPAAEKYTIYLSNNFLGNDWRQQMERVAKVSVSRGPLAGRVDLHIENVETTVQAQINSLNNIIRRKPDAILVDAGSGTALNPTIKRACSQGILVISFDQVVTERCAYKVQSNFGIIPKVQAAWLAKILHGKGQVFVDSGLAGAPISAAITNGFKSVLKKYPGIKIIGTFNGSYALGPEQSGVASLLSAHPEVDGILTQGYGSGALKALKQAGHGPVPVTGFSYNTSAVTCVQTKGAKCILGSNAPYLSSESIKLAVEVLDGKQPNKPRNIFLYTPYFTTDLVAIKGYGYAKMEKLKIGKNAFPNLPPGLTLPISPAWVKITPQEAAGTK